MRIVLALCVVGLVVVAAASPAAVSRVPSFGASKRYAVPPGRGCDYCSQSSATGDLNGDGRPDVVSVDADQTVSVFITKPDGTFRARRDYLTGGEPTEAVIADLTRTAMPMSRLPRPTVSSRSS